MKTKNKKFKVHAHTFLTFFVSAVLCTFLVGISIHNKINIDKMVMEQIIMEKSLKINEVISKLLYKTEALSALVIQSNGNVENFEKVASTIIDDSAILNVLMAPNGVVSDVYPLSGNEAVIGFDFFKDGAGNKEAVLAKEKGRLVFGGPFTLVQGGDALVGRLPVYLNNGGDENEKGSFWGIVSVTLKYPEALDDVGLNMLEVQGYAYEIWRMNPDTRERQSIAQSNHMQNKNAIFIEKHIPILNANWYFKLSPNKVWYEYLENWLLFLVGLFVSFLISYIVQNNYNLKLVKSEMEKNMQLDYLLGIYNRRYFMEAGAEQVYKINKLHKDCYIILFDVDNFKRVNDTYGHAAGDYVLKEIVRIVNNELSPSDIFARYGGEEFIILLSDVDKDYAMKFANTLCANLYKEAIKYEDKSIRVSASFGVSASTSFESSDFENSIKTADEALYKAKEQGRNRVIFM